MRIDQLIACALVTSPLLFASCLHLDQRGQRDSYVWVDSLEATPIDPAAFELQPGDTIRLDVWKQNDISGNQRIRSDGKITVPLVGDVLVAGLSPHEASDVVAEALVRVVRNPTVVIGVVEVRPIQVGVLGEVQSPGMYQLERGNGVLHAIAMAGGLTEYADSHRIFVIRNGHSEDESAIPIRFSYRTLIQARGAAVEFRLASGDIVVVE